MIFFKCSDHSHSWDDTVGSVLAPAHGTTLNLRVGKRDPYPEPPPVKTIPKGQEGATWLPLPKDDWVPEVSEFCLHGL